MAFFRALSGRVQIVWTVSFSNPRSKPAEVSAEEARRAGVPASPSTLAEAVPAAVGWARERSGAVVITGSIYLAGDALQVCSGLGLAADNPSSDST
jgi:folylpolyglutamate synthase/dihydropteroate synthase